MSQGARPSRLRLLAPLRYLSIKGPEKNRYDLVAPIMVGIGAWVVYMIVDPRPPLFGEGGLLRFARDLLVMAVPFMVGALAAVAMGAPGPHMDRRPVGAPLYLDGGLLTLRQFVCHLLGYLCFLGLVTLIGVVGAELGRDMVLAWTTEQLSLRAFIHGFGSLVLSLLLSFLTVTVFWALYFLSVIVNRP